MGWRRRFRLGFGIAGLFFILASSSQLRAGLFAIGKQNGVYRYPADLKLWLARRWLSIGESLGLGEQQ